MIKKYHVSKNLYPLDINKLHVGRVETDGTIDYEVGSLSISGDTITYTYNTPWRGFYTDYISIGSATTLTMSPIPPNGTTSCSCYDNTNNFLGRADVVTMSNSRVFTLIEGTTKIRIAASSADTVFSITKPQLEVGNVATAYEPYGNTWTEIPYRIFNTSQDTITSLPVDIYTDGQSIGANLFDISTVEKGRIDNGAVGYASATTDLSVTGNKIEFTTDAKFRGVCGGFIEIPNGAESISFYGTFKGGSGIGKRLVFYNAQKTWLNADVIFGIADNDGTATILNGAKFVRMSFTAQEPGTASISNFMLNTGPTALPYQPYAPTIIKGNMSQSDTPSPSSIIMPSECGDRTGNLWNNTFTVGYHLSQLTGLPVAFTTDNSRMATLTPIDVATIESVTFNFTNLTPSSFRVMYSTFTANDTLIERVANKEAPFAIDTSNASKLYIAIYRGSGSDDISESMITNVMLNAGSTSLPYEPYGYKLDIKSGNTTTPVYLGNVQSTRWIKKLVLTGQENWTEYGSGSSRFFYTSLSTTGYNDSKLVMSTHFQYTAGSSADYSISLANTGTSLRIYDRTTNWVDATAFATWLAAQYTAGTPVTVWYVLADETTGIVNEPIRKIGNYADSVSVTGIPTTSGGIEFDVDTSLKPSEVSLTYHGWHSKTPKRKSANLFDKDNATVKTLYIDSSLGTFRTSSNAKTVIMSCEPNTTYTISKMLSARFSVAYSAQIPVSGDTANGAIDNPTGTNITITTDNNARYLSMFIYNLAYDTATFEDIENSIMVDEGYTPLPYAPYWE